MDTSSELRTRIGARLRGMRRARRLSLRELAWSAECSASALSYIENGRNYPSFDLLIRLADRLGTTVDRLLRDEHAEPEDPAPAGAGGSYRPFVLAPGERRTVTPLPWPAAYGILFILEGTVAVRMEGRVSTLVSGSSLQFDPSRQQEYANAGVQDAFVLWGGVAHPGLGRSRAAS